MLLLLHVKARAVYGLQARERVERERRKRLRRARREFLNEGSTRMEKEGVEVVYTYTRERHTVFAAVGISRPVTCKTAVRSITFFRPRFFERGD